MTCLAFEVCLQKLSFQTGPAGTERGDIQPASAEDFEPLPLNIPIYRGLERGYSLGKNNLACFLKVEIMY